MKRLHSPSALVCVGVLLLLSACASEDPTDSPTSGELKQGAIEAAKEITNQQAEDQFRAEFPTGALPEAEFVRVVTSTDWPEAMAQCLQARGFDAVAKADGGVDSGFPPELAESHAVATYQCRTSYPIDSTGQELDSKEELEGLYDYYRDDLVPCLESQGWSQENDPPSLSSFIETYDSDPWIPYAVVDPTSEDDWFALNKVCPQSPPTQ